MSIDQQRQSGRYPGLLLGGRGVDSSWMLPSALCLHTGEAAIWRRDHPVCLMHDLAVCGEASVFLSFYSNHEPPLHTGFHFQAENSIQKDQLSMDAREGLTSATPPGHSAFFYARCKLLPGLKQRYSSGQSQWNAGRA